MKFLANMGISPRTVEFLRARGHDAVHLHERGLDRLADIDILDKARSEGSIVLTSDLGFGELAYLSGKRLPSVIIFRLRPPMRSARVNDCLLRVINERKLDLEQGAILSVTENQIRVRRLYLL